MKKIYLSALILFALAGSASAQKYQYRGRTIFPTDSTSGKIAYTEVIAAPGVSATQLYRRAKEWAVLDKKKFERVKVSETPEENRLVGVFTTAGKYYVYCFNLAVDARDGKARAKISDITYGTGNTLDSWILAKGGKAVDRDYELLNQDFLAVMDSLKKALTTPEQKF